MTPSIAILTLGVTALADVLPARAINAAGAVPAPGAGCAGVTVMEGRAGLRVPYVALGTVPATAGGAVAVDSALQVGSAGKLVVRTTGITVARALTAASADGDEIGVLLIAN